MNKTNGKTNNTGYRGKYYDPNYKQNKAKYGDLYDPRTLQYLIQIINHYKESQVQTTKIQLTDIIQIIILTSGKVNNEEKIKLSLHYL